MIDLELVRNDPQTAIRLIKKKDPDFDIKKLIDLDQQVRDIRFEVEELRNKKNILAQEGKAGITSELRGRSKKVSTLLKEHEHLLDAVQKDFDFLYLRCPNVPLDDVPVGNKEANKVVKVVGEQPHYSFEPKDHVALGAQNHWFDHTAATTMSGAGFMFYTKESVSVLYALAMFMLKHNKQHGFDPVIPPYLITNKSLECSSNFPRFTEDTYGIVDEDLYLSPTAEVNLTNRYRNHIFDAEHLPVRMTAWSSCFRREAGGYGAAERGMIRIHQFEKVELYSITQPEHDAQELDRMVACAESILQKLGLHYRVSLLAAQDTSFQAAKTYDIEAWLPGQKAYYEVSSASTCATFQARRSKIRYRQSEGQKPRLVHTLNASSLALPRLMVALMETYQQEDGSIAIPDVLKETGFWL